MDDPGGLAVGHLPRGSVQRFDQELNRPPSTREEMYSIYDLSLSATLSVLLALSAITTPNDSPQSPNRKNRVYSWLFYGARISVFILALTLTCLPSRWRNQFKVFRNTVLLATWAVYAYRDIWPLATYDLTPIDEAEGNVLWAKIGLLTLAAIVLPLVSPRRTDDPDARPEQRASIFSLVTYGWLDSLIWKAQHLRHLPLEDLPPLAEYNSVHKLVEDSYANVDPMQTNGRDVAWGLVKYFYRDLAVMGTMVILASASSFLVPLGLKHILAYVENGPDHETFKPWVWILALLLGSMAVSMCMQFYHYVSTQVVARTQAILTQLMFDHALKMRSKASTSSKKAALGKLRGGRGNMPAITNLVTTDLTNVTNASTFVLLILLETPIQVVLSVVFLHSILGWSTFVGVAVMIAMFPVPTKLSQRTKGLQGAKAKATDRRVTLAMQMLDVIRTVKFLGWESEQASKLRDARTDELRAVRKVTMMQIWIGAINVCIPLLIMLASYTTFTVAMKRELSASIVFSSIALFEILRSQLGLIFFRVPILTNGKCKVSLDRINRFLRETELLDQYTVKKADDTRPGENGHALSRRFLDSDIGFQPAQFTWTNDTTQDDRHFVLNIQQKLTFEENKLNVIHGPTASGKTSMLMALLGEMHCISYSGEHSVVNLPRAGGVAFAAQESWVMADTVQNNILFGQRYDADRYNRVLEACALDEDIESFPDGNETMIGERGITLSGGQKTRVTLARAVYSRAKILLLDDVLTSLDNRTVHHIVRQCLKGKLLVGRTVILVTHNVAAVMPFADLSIELGPNGTIVNVGPPLKLYSPPPSPSHTPPNGRLPTSLAGDRPAEHQLIKDEEIEEGHVGWKPMTLLFSNMAAYPILFWIAFLGTLFLASIVLNAQIWLLGYWANQYSEEPAARVSVALYIGIYVALLVGSMFTDAASRVMHLAGTLEASAKIHEKLTSSILGTTLRWLDSTPAGRIVARCTEDIGAVDGQISGFLLKLLELSTSMIVRLVLVVIVAPIFTAAVVVFGSFSALYARAYMKAQLPVKREQSKTRAPLIGHLNSTVVSLVSIRAYGAEETFKNDMHTRIDRWTRASNTFYNLNRWVIVRADLIGTIFTVSLAIYLTYFTELNASNIGFSLNMSIAFSSKVFEFVRTLNTFEVAGNSLERIQQYLEIEQEDTSGVTEAEDAAWPTNGELLVENLSASYSLDGPRILENISFSVSSGERIGIVGRTGGGKSTLTLALLRCIPTNIPPPNLLQTEPGGKAVYSGRSIGEVSLTNLRKNITIIPQTPELFQGTIRQNLDPFGLYKEAELKGALLGAQGLDDAPQGSDSDRLELDTQVSSGGKNLSAGQRQIVALARAMIRKTKLLIMDEATSSIDNASDTMIQTALRKQLDRSVTVLTVAHRLSTIKDYDKVLVLDPESKVEFGKLRDLLDDKKSRFRELVDSAPQEEKDSIFAAVGLRT